MPPGERVASVGELRSWTDEIPFHYEYTAGLAGEKFLRGLAKGKILASHCTNCGRRYLPPKAYCVNCYRAVSEYVEVGTWGRASGVAVSHVAFDGTRLRRPKTFVFVTYAGTEGGLVHFASGEGLQVGDRVEPVFRPAKKRKGSVLDIEGFRRADFRASRR